MAFKFAHMADCHLGAWSMHPELSELPLKAFDYAMDRCMDSGVDFILISGDLFDTSIPGVDVLKRCAGKMKQVVDFGIRIYVVPGSHDFSASGKTMISVLESAGLITNVAKGYEEDGKLKLKFFQDKTGVWVAGILGRRGGLERSYYEALKMDAPEGFKIFMMHSAITEYKPQHLQKMESLPLSLLPRGFGYYANGHVHMKFEKDEDFGKIVFPGSLFPTELKEMEKGAGGFFIVDDKLNTKYIEIPLCRVKVIAVNADNKTPSGIEEEITEQISGDLKNTVVLVKIRGTLESGRPSDIDFRSIISKAEEKGAIALKRSISQLMMKEMEEIGITSEHVEDIEDKIITEHLGQMNIFRDEKTVVKELMKALAEEKGDATSSVYEERVLIDAKKVLGV